MSRHIIRWCGGNAIRLDNMRDGPVSIFIDYETPAAGALDKNLDSFSYGPEPDRPLRFDGFGDLDGYEGQSVRTIGAVVEMLG